MKDRNYRYRLYTSAATGWLAAFVLFGSTIAMFFGDEVMIALHSCGFCLVSAATKIDPNDRTPWWIRAGSAGMGAFTALLSLT